MSVDIIVGDVRAQLRLLPSEYFDCVVTSPPYWGLRDYGCEGQIGLEPTLGEHLEVMVDVFREVRRVLKQHGTLWLNYGDCYAAAPNGKAAAAYKADGSDDRTFRDKPFSTVGPIQGRTYYGEQGGSRGVDRDFHDHMRPKAGAIYQAAATTGGQRGDPKRLAVGETIPRGRVVAGGFLKPKDLCMIPNRLAIALQDDGWWVRSEIIWHKPNPMPESVYDRPTSAHEKIWLLTKGEDYFYNHEAIREPVTGGTKARMSQDIAKQAGSLRANGGTRPDRPMKAGGTGVGWGHLDRLDPDGGDRGRDRIKRPGPGSRENLDRTPRSRKVPEGWDQSAGAHGNINRNGRGGGPKIGLADEVGVDRGKRAFMGTAPDLPTKDLGRAVRGLRVSADMGRPLGWRDEQDDARADTRNARNVWSIAPRSFRDAHFATFPPALAERCIKAGVPSSVCALCGEAKDPADCGGMCASLPRAPGRVLDPFGGAGTVGLVAHQMGLSATLIELNPEYAEISRRRIFGAPIVKEAAE